ncbi:MAG: aldehyde dehydrogenase family protein, partial [Comamonas sp.]
MPLTLSRPELQRTGNFIAGEWLAPEAGRSLDVTDPATGAVIAAVPDSNAADARAAVDAAHAAFPAWRRTPAKQRAQIL